MSDEYLPRILRAEALFHYQLVYNPLVRDIIHFIPPNLQSTIDIHGPQVEENILIELGTTNDLIKDNHNNNNTELNLTFDQYCLGYVSIKDYSAIVPKYPWDNILLQKPISNNNQMNGQKQGTSGIWNYRRTLMNFLMPKNQTVNNNTNNNSNSHYYKNRFSQQETISKASSVSLMTSVGSYGCFQPIVTRTSTVPMLTPPTLLINSTNNSNSNNSINKIDKIQISQSIETSTEKIVSPIRLESQLSVHFNRSSNFDIYCDEISDNKIALSSTKLEIIDISEENEIPIKIEIENKFMKENQTPQTVKNIYSTPNSVNNNNPIMIDIDDIFHRKIHLTSDLLSPINKMLNISTITTNSIVTTHNIDTTGLPPTNKRKFSETIVTIASKNNGSNKKLKTTIMKVNAITSFFKVTPNKLN